MCYKLPIICGWKLTYTKKLIKSKVEENKDPDIISQLRGVLKKGYSSVKDPVSKKKMKVDTYTASDNVFEINTPEDYINFLRKIS